MAQLQINQFIALLKGAKGRVESTFTEAYRQLQKAAPFTGVSQSYTPKDEDGEQLATTGHLLQLRVPEVLRDLVPPLSELIDLATTVEAGNQIARAAVVVDGEEIIPEVPVTALLMLERKLVDIATTIRKLPTLDPSEKWEYDAQNAQWCTSPTTKNRTKKLPRNHEKAPATDKHPAQVEVFYEDLTVGTYSTTNYSGAIPPVVQREMLAKVTKLQAAVKIAREQANTTKIDDVRIAARIFTYLGW